MAASSKLPSGAPPEETLDARWSEQVRLEVSLLASNLDRPPPPAGEPAALKPDPPEARPAPRDEAS